MRKWEYRQDKGITQGHMGQTQQLSQDFNLTQSVLVSTYLSLEKLPYSFKKWAVCSHSSDETATLGEATRTLGKSWLLKCNLYPFPFMGMEDEPWWSRGDDRQVGTRTVASMADAGLSKYPWESLRRHPMIHNYSHCHTTAALRVSQVTTRI